ncbi:MAG: NUDIX hydrolase [Lacisediminihabitans sp.]
MNATDRHRLTSRILVLDEENRILLFLTRGSVPAQRTRWITPGGGVEPGESHAEGARRELFEETGLDLEPLGSPVWSHDFAVDYAGGDHDTGHAEYFFTRVRNFEPSNANWTPEEHVDVLATRWWTLSELMATTEPYEPAELISLARRQVPRPAERRAAEQRRERWWSDAERPDAAGPNEAFPEEIRTV